MMKLQEFDGDSKKRAIAFQKKGEAISLINAKNDFNVRAALLMATASLKTLSSHTLPDLQFLADCYVHLGNIYRRDKEYDAAIAHFQNAITCCEKYFEELSKIYDPSDVTYMNHLIVNCNKQLGIIYNYLLQFKDAMIVLEKSYHYKDLLTIEISELAELYKELAYAYNHNGKFNEAQVLCQKAMLIYYKIPDSSDNARIEIGECYQILGYSHLKLEQYKEACSAYQMAIGCYISINDKSLIAAHALPIAYRKLQEIYQKLAEQASNEIELSIYTFGQTCFTYRCRVLGWPGFFFAQDIDNSGVIKLRHLLTIAKGLDIKISIMLSELTHLILNILTNSFLPDIFLTLSLDQALHKNFILEQLAYIDNDIIRHSAGQNLFSLNISAHEKPLQQDGRLDNKYLRS
jgi:tetratricopeptide (TPR) repeat protein